MIRMRGKSNINLKLGKVTRDGGQEEDQQHHLDIGGGDLVHWCPEGERQQQGCGRCPAVEQNNSENHIFS